VVESVAENDETCCTNFWKARPSALKNCAPRCARAHRSQAVPRLCGTAFKNKGVQTLLDAVVDYLPSPLDIPRRKVTIPIIVKFS